MRACRGTCGGASACSVCTTSACCGRSSPKRCASTSTGTPHARAARSATQDILGREPDARVFRRDHARLSCRGWRSQRGRRTRAFPRPPQTGPIANRYAWAPRDLGTGACAFGRAGFASRGTAVARAASATCSRPCPRPKKSWVALLARCGVLCGPVVDGQSRRHHRRRRAVADLPGRLDGEAAEHVVGAVFRQRFECGQRRAVADLAEGEDRVAAHGRVDVARQDVEDRAGRARVADLPERGQDALFRGQVGAAQEELLDEQTGRLLRVRVAERVDRLDADAHVRVIRGLQQILDRLRLVDLAERPHGLQTRLGVVAVQLPDVLVELLVVLRLVVAVPQAVAALLVERELREAERGDGDRRQREERRARPARHRAASLAQGPFECNTAAAHESSSGTKGYLIQARPRWPCPCATGGWPSTASRGFSMRERSRSSSPAPTTRPPSFTTCSWTPPGPAARTITRRSAAPRAGEESRPTTSSIAPSCCSGRWPSAVGWIFTASSALRRSARAT